MQTGVHAVINGTACSIRQQKLEFHGVVQLVQLLAADCGTRVWSAAAVTETVYFIQIGSGVLLAHYLVGTGCASLG